MSRFYDSCVNVFGSCCGVCSRNRKSNSSRKRRESNIRERNVNNKCGGGTSHFDKGGPFDLSSESEQLQDNNNIKKKMTAHNGIFHVSMRNGLHGKSTSNNTSSSAGNCSSINNMSERTVNESNLKSPTFGNNPSSSSSSSKRSNSKVKTSIGGTLVTSVQDKLFDGLMKVFSDTLESLVFVLCPVGSVPSFRGKVHRDLSSPLCYL